MSSAKAVYQYSNLVPRLVNLYTNKETDIVTNLISSVISSKLPYWGLQITTLLLIPGIHGG